MRTPKLLLRLASGLLVLNGLALGIAHVHRWDMASPDGRQVLTGMSRKLDFGGAARSYLELYSGMTLNLIALYGFEAVLLWLLSGKVRLYGGAVRGALVATAVFLGVSSVLSFVYAFAPPAIMQGAACVFCILALLAMRGQAGDEAVVKDGAAVRN